MLKYKKFKSRKVIIMSLQITTQNFDNEVLKSDRPVLVDFWATWCGPCRMQSPIVDELAKSRTDVKVGKINVDEEPALAEKFNVNSIPTLMVFKDGKNTATAIGVQSQSALEALLSK